MGTKIKTYRNVFGSLNDEGNLLPNNNILYGPHESIDEAYNTIYSALENDIPIGLTIGVKENNKVIEYWFNGGIKKEHLIQKTLNENIKHYIDNSSKNYIKNKINLTNANEITSAQSNLTNANEILYYLITDSNGKLPSEESCYDIPINNIRLLNFTSPDKSITKVLRYIVDNLNIEPIGVNVGDIIAFVRVKILVADLANILGVNIPISGEIELYQYKIISTNDAKPINHKEASAGVFGLMSPEDKYLVSKIPKIENQMQPITQTEYDILVAEDKVENRLYFIIED